MSDRRGAALNWVVPIDDTNTLNIGFGDIDKSLPLEGRDSYVDRTQKLGVRAVGAGGISTSLISRARAISTAAIGPLPPNATRAKSRGSRPRYVVTALTAQIGRAHV